MKVMLTPNDMLFLTNGFLTAFYIFSQAQILEGVVGGGMSPIVFNF